VLADGGEGIDEGSNVITFNLVLKNDETGPTRANEPLLELVLNLLKRGAIGGQIPGCRIAIPNRGYYQRRWPALGRRRLRMGRQSQGTRPPVEW